MPSRNVLKEDSPNSYYHIYARGASKQPIFLDDSDFNFFVHLFERYLSSNSAVDKSGVTYPNFHNRLRLLCHCLMKNHFHLLIYQKETGDMASFMRSAMTSYSRYFNHRHKRTGSLFESRYKASRIDTQAYLEHISRYIHLNPRYWKNYRYSSIGFYSRGKVPDWFDASTVLEIFNSRTDYMKFLEDYEEHKSMLDEIKHELADR